MILHHLQSLQVYGTLLQPSPRQSFYMAACSTLCTTRQLFKSLRTPRLHMTGPEDVPVMQGGDRGPLLEPGG